MEQVMGTTQRYRDNGAMYGVDKESRFVASFDDSMRDMYMNTLKKLKLEDNFEIEIIDSWEGKPIPRAYSLYIKEHTDRNEASRFCNEISNTIRGNYDVLVHPIRNLHLPLMALTNEDTTRYTQTLARIKRKQRFLLSCIGRNDFNQIFASIDLTQRCDKEKKKYLYWTYSENAKKKSTDLPNFLFQLTSEEQNQKLN